MDNKNSFASEAETVEGGLNKGKYIYVCPKCGKKVHSIFHNVKMCPICNVAMDCLEVNE